MKEECNEILLAAIAGFNAIHKQDRRQSYALLISIFITCYGILAPEDRMKCLRTLYSMIQDVDMELFEDGTDFITFLKEKALERGYKPEEPNAKDTNN